MSIELSDLDVYQSDVLRRLEILQDIEGHRLPLENGVILVSCGDGRRFYDLFTKVAERVIIQRGDPRIHPLPRNGGALRIPADSPVNKPGRTTDIDLLDEIRETAVMMSISIVALYVHAPCGKAYEAGLDLIQVTRLLVAAKRRLKREIPGITVACFMHIHHRDGRDRSYFVSRTQFEKHATINPQIPGFES